MAHLFKKAGFVLAIFTGMQVFGGEQSKKSWWSYLPWKKATTSDYVLGKQVAELSKEKRDELRRGIKAYDLKQEQEKQLEQRYLKAGAYTAAGLVALMASDAMLDTPAAGGRAKRLLRGSVGRLGIRGGVAVAGAGGLIMGALALKYYNNNVLTPERVEAFKERTPVYNYYTLGDSSY